MSVRLRFALLASSSLLLLFFFQLASAQTDPAACSVSCRFVIVPTLGPQGLPGLNGTKGDTGAMGQEGQKGDKGDQGEPGIDGVDGKDGINGTNGVDGKDATFDSTATYIGLKLEAPVLTGAISIDGAALTGTTSIDGAALTGTTTIGEGATILQPNITAPIIDGATIIGEGATLAKPTMNQPSISNADLTGATKIGIGATLTRPAISHATLSGQTRASHAMMVTSMDASICPSWSNAGILYTSSPCDLRPRSVGGIVYWSSGQTSRIVQVINGTTATIYEFGSTDAVPASVKRDLDPDVKFYFSTKSFSASHSHTNMQAPTIHDGTAMVKLSLAPMAADTVTTWGFPATEATDTLVGTSAAQTVSNKVINASQTTGHLRMKNYGSLGISDPGDASAGYTMINVTITGSLVITDAELFLPNHVGNVLEWSDGATAAIQSVGSFIGAVGSTNFTAARAFLYPRGWQMVKWWTANTMLSNNFAVFQDKIALKGTSVFGLPISAVVIDMTKMRVDAGVRHQTSWTFPNPGPAGQQNYFVGEESVQTLKNKKFDRILGSIGLSHPSVTSTTGSPQMGFGSTTLAGLVKANFQTPSANSIAWTLTLPASATSWLSLTPANEAAAALTGTQQVWVEHHNGGGSPPTNVFTCKMGSTALPTGVTYAWVYHVIGGL